MHHGSLDSLLALGRVFLIFVVVRALAARASLYVVGCSYCVLSTVYVATLVYLRITLARLYAALCLYDRHTLHISLRTQTTRVRRLSKISKKIVRGAPYGARAQVARSARTPDTAHSEALWVAGPNSG